MKINFQLATLLVLGLLAPATSLQAAEAGTIEFNRDIRPILTDNCFACHGADSASRKAGLRLDHREDAIDYGAIAPEDPDNSSMLARMLSDDPDQVMPPPSTKKTLTAEQKALIKQWIAEGAEYQPHWSYIAPERPALPEVNNQAWVATPIDAFVLAELEANGLSPAPEADRRTLARRVSLDLTGLPPAPELVEAFVNDPAPNAYEKLVDQLLASPKWGEHQGRYWLDVARYGDTHGIHNDNFREIWVYRDWVIQAFNKNQPFDQFTIEQLAGDLLPNRTLDQQIASGFNRCNITTSEGGAINEEYLVLYARDRTETTSTVWLALTTGCAVCHDHKFDPITQREFYELSAFFNNTTQAAMDGNIKNTPPVVEVLMPEDRETLPLLENQLAEANKQLEDRKSSARADFDTWLAGDAAARLSVEPPTAGLELHAPLNTGDGNTLDIAVRGKVRPIALGTVDWQEGPFGQKAVALNNQVQAEFADVGNFDHNQSFCVAAWVKFPQAGAQGAIVARMEEPPTYRGWDLWAENGHIGMHIVHHWPHDAIKTVTNAPLPVGEWQHVLVSHDGTGTPAGIKVYLNGIAQPTTPQAHKLSHTTLNDVPLKLGQRDKSSRINHAVLQDLRIYDRVLDASEVHDLSQGAQVRSLLAQPAAERTPEQIESIFAWWLATQDAVHKELKGKIADLEKQRSTIHARKTVAHVMQERPTPPEAYVLDRGEYDRRTDKVAPGTPAVLPPMPEDLPRNRLGFAQWLLRPENPLTARVTVNRFWQQLYGTGIVRTTGDFGVSGELPSNQPLIDWMAVEFRESGWDVKRFFKLLVMSNTYRQSAAITPEKLEKDPDNRLCSRGPRFRMDAEMVRDYALAASGLLVNKIGGPSVKPYQPEGVWEAVAMRESNTRHYKRDSGDDLYRRSMYTFWKRSAPPASMDIFNAPSRETCTVRRERTNTPLQALVTMNDPQLIEAARHLATLALKSSDDDAARLQLLSARLLSRPLRPEELTIVQTSLADLSAHYQQKEEDAKALLAVGESPVDESLPPATLAAWTMLTNELMNLDEVLNK